MYVFLLNIYVSIDLQSHISAPTHREIKELKKKVKSFDLKFF